MFFFFPSSKLGFQLSFLSGIIPTYIAVGYRCVTSGIWLLVVNRNHFGRCGVETQATSAGPALDVSVGSGCPI